MPLGNTCVAIKAESGNNGGWVYAHPDNDWVWCDGVQADTSSKWAGWNTGPDSEWHVDSIEYAHAQSLIGDAKPVILGSAVVDAMYSSTS